MHAIDVDFDVYKLLTVRRETEEVSYNDVIRELLGLKQHKAKITIEAMPSASDWVVKGVRFPSATEFRASYKGQIYLGKVEGGTLIFNNKIYASPSAAAVAITKSAVNGWRFWECKLPGSAKWQLIEYLRK
jgi:predicted CopG family antitoxin